MVPKVIKEWPTKQILSAISYQTTCHPQQKPNNIPWPVAFYVELDARNMSCGEQSNCKQKIYLSIFPDGFPCRYYSNYCVLYSNITYDDVMIKAIATEAKRGG